MLQGLKQLAPLIRNRGSQLICIHGQATDVIVKMQQTCKPKIIIFDKAYLKTPREWRQKIVEQLKNSATIMEVIKKIITIKLMTKNCQSFAIESDVIVPVEVASTQSEDSAANMRRKLLRHAEDYLVPLLPTELEIKILDTNLDQIKNNYFKSLNINIEQYIDIESASIQSILQLLDTDSTVPIVKDFQGGPVQAEKFLEDFLENKLYKYGDRDHRYDVMHQACSNLSPYLHYGQISALYIAIRVLQYTPAQNDINNIHMSSQQTYSKPITQLQRNISVDLNASKGRFIDELFIRRELCTNFVWYKKDVYWTFDALPNWAQQSLENRSDDPREHVYSQQDMEDGKTHDQYWNAAQMEMVKHGKMHNYLRMYWAKKILEWTESPREAIRIALYLNDKYELDGRGAGGYVGTLWSIGGLHDRPFPERNIFGKVRYMNANGLKQKINNLDEYCKKYNTNKTKRPSVSPNKNIIDMFKKAKKK